MPQWQAHGHKAVGLRSVFKCLFSSAVQDRHFVPVLVAAAPALSNQEMKRAVNTQPNCVSVSIKGMFSSPLWNESWISTFLGYLAFSLTTLYSKCLDGRKSHSDCTRLEIMGSVRQKWLQTRSNHKPGTKAEADHVFLRNTFSALERSLPASVGNRFLTSQDCASLC